MFRNVLAALAMFITFTSTAFAADLSPTWKAVAYTSQGHVTVFEGYSRVSTRIEAVDACERKFETKCFTGVAVPIHGEILVMRCDRGDTNILKVDSTYAALGTYYPKGSKEVVYVPDEFLESLGVHIDLCLKGDYRTF